MDGRAPSPELRWLACREKNCCHDARVVIHGRDLWRIATMLEVAPWDFTWPAPAEPEAAGAFRLEAGGGAHQIALARRGRTTARRAPCVFLWKLGDGHAQCGLGSSRPLACQGRPAGPVNGQPRPSGCGCTCLTGSVVDPTPEPDPALVGAVRREAAEHREVVEMWNRGLEPGARSTYRDFCVHMMAAYGRMA
jgi:hypothetical protein